MRNDDREQHKTPTVDKRSTLKKVSAFNSSLKKLRTSPSSAGGRSLIKVRESLAIAICEKSKCFLETDRHLEVNVTQKYNL